MYSTTTSHTQQWHGDGEQFVGLNPLLNRGYYYDSDTELYYLQSRYYDPNLCRFINSDVFGISSITKDTNAIDWAIALIPVIRSFNSVLKSFNVSRKAITQIVKTITKFLKNNRTAIKKLLVTALKKVKVKSAYTWANRILKIVNYISKLNTFLMTISKISVGNLIVWGIGLFAKHKYMYAKKYITFGAKVRVKYYIF